MEVPVSRNALCPCGSGRRYKACHGAVAGGAPVTQSTPAAAQARLDAGDHAGAAAIARDVLERQPDQPEALRILARVLHHEGRPEEALPLLLRAARALPQHPLPAAPQYAVWTALNFMFTQVLSGLDATRAGRLRTDYHAAMSAPDPAQVATGLASLVVIGGADPQHLRAALERAVEQTWRPLEIVVVHPLRTKPLQPATADDVTWQWLQVPVEAGAAARIDAGVRASRGSTVAVLDDAHRHAPDRIASMLAGLQARGAQWGFSDVRFVNAAGDPVAPESDPLVARLRTLLEAIPEADTVGYALFHHDFVAVDACNLVFRRSLFDALDGFRDLPATFAWDFALRALWLAEPVYVPKPLYVHRLLPDAIAQQERERAQIAMFSSYYARATGTEPPPNRFAPSLAVWGLHFLKTPFQTGHVLAFAHDELQRLATLAIEARRATAAQALTPGLNLVGFAFGEFGLGESLRAIAAACETDGVPFVVKDVDMRLRSRQADRTVAPHVSDVLRHRVSLYCLNPDMLQPVQALMTTTRALGGRNIGYWYWELETLPRVWDDALARVDEIWVATEFCAEAMRRACDKPVMKIPPPLEVRLSRPYARAEFDLPDDRFMFLFSFDFNSFIRRKNPEAAILAFRQAFPPGRDDVGLVVKSINGTAQPEKMKAMLALAGGDRRIFLRDGFLSRDQVFGLESVVDAFVSLHRAEGLGLGLAESMYLGKPVIATAYSGNLEFMTPDNSGLVGYRMVPVLPGEYLYDDPRFQWADPDVDDAARLMRRLADDASYRIRIAAAGQRTIRNDFNRARTAALVRARLDALHLLDGATLVEPPASWGRSIAPSPR